jgi:hypothetical protein
MKTKKLFVLFLCIVMIATTATSVSAWTSPQTVNPTASTVLINGTPTAFEAYLIHGNNFFRLRDLAYALNGSNKQFAVGWDGAANAISLTSSQPYEPVGGEMALGAGTPQVATPTTARVFLDGVELNLTAYNINGNNFFRLRDIMSALDVGVTWDATTSTIGVDTSIGYQAEVSPPPQQEEVPAPAPSLVGTWIWLGSPYYVFEDGGRGVMVPGPFETEIRWWSSNGVLYVCITPDLCVATCIAPMGWYYTISGNQLTLTSTDMPDMVFTYTRR